jgi:uncharacterized membrane protein
MARSNSGLSDEQIDQTLGSLLRVGVVVSAAIDLVGGAVCLMRHEAGSCELHGLFRNQAALRQVVVHSGSHR